MKEWSRFEQTIIVTNLWYQRQKLGVVAKIPTGTRAVRNYGSTVFVPSEKTGCDFIGHLKGVPVAFDCKSTATKTRFNLFSHNKPTVSPHQKKFLLDFKETGGAAFLLIQFNPLHKVFLLDIEKYMTIESHILSGGGKNIPLSYFVPFEVAEHLYYYDYLEKMESLELISNDKQNIGR
ncbi:Holliday junction resolvase RecU [Enterococcus termitis]|uniref:Holliday junction resolvase RecU n=1 Tax=Enterococcus termitis TaxID=332950 RepID=A0A1E5GU12_9ENTE|nr:Holliday junction resolvase RecU [Enterococcus termitis]OEG16161.1 recombinase RecU [Enterococcus termitis]